MTTSNHGDWCQWYNRCKVTFIDTTTTEHVRGILRESLDNLNSRVVIYESSVATRSQRCGSSASNFSYKERQAQERKTKWRTEQKSFRRSKNHFGIHLWCRCLLADAFNIDYTRCEHQRHPVTTNTYPARGISRCHTFFLFSFSFSLFTMQINFHRCRRPTFLNDCIWRLFNKKAKTRKSQKKVGDQSKRWLFALVICAFISWLQCIQCRQR